jgi:hypothetical protein
MPHGAKFGGRKKGTPNKLTRDIKEAILNAFEKVGGEDYLVILAKEDPKTFAALLGKVLPVQVQAELKAETGITLQVVSGIERTPDAPTIDGEAFEVLPLPEAQTPLSELTEPVQSTHEKGPPPGEP